MPAVCWFCILPDGHHLPNCDFNMHEKSYDVDKMNLTIRLTDLSIRTERKLTEDEARKLISERINDALSNEPFIPGAFVQRYTMQLDVEVDREFNFLTYAVETLKALDRATRMRVLNYLVNRFGEK